MGGGGDENYLQEKGGGGGDGKFLKALYIVDRGLLTPYLMKTPPVLATTPASPFFQFLSTTTTTPNFLSPPTPTPTVFPVDLFL